MCPVNMVESHAAGYGSLDQTGLQCHLIPRAKSLNLGRGSGFLTSVDVIARSEQVNAGQGTYIGHIAAQNALRGLQSEVDAQATQSLSLIEKVSDLGRVNIDERKTTWRRAFHGRHEFTQARHELVSTLIASLGHIPIELRFGLTSSEIKAAFQEAWSLNPASMSYLTKIREQLARLPSLAEREVFYNHILSHIQHANAEQKASILSTFCLMDKHLNDFRQIAGTSPLSRTIKRTIETEWRRAFEEACEFQESTLHEAHAQAVSSVASPADTSQRIVGFNLNELVKHERS